MSTVAESGQKSADAPPSAPSVSAEAIQRLVDEAAYFNVLSIPESHGSDAVIRGSHGVTGVHINEVLHRFAVDTSAPTKTDPLRASNAVGEPLGKMHQRWMVIPDDFVAAPGREPPPTPLDPTRSQRFVMLDGKCTLGAGADGFRGFGTGHTHPTTVNGQPRLLATAVGTILEGFGKFAGHNEGTYLYCGTLAPNQGFTGNVMLRVMDSQKTLHTTVSLPAIRRQGALEEGITYAIFRGEAVPSDPVKPNIGPDGKPIGLIVEQGLRLQHVDSAVDRHGIRATDRVGQLMGRITAYVTFDPKSASGTVLDPIPFTAYDECVFYGRGGETVGSLIADSSEGRVFNMALGGQQAIRFGGVGSIRGGTGAFEGIGGLLTDNSVVVFTPHVSASIYVMRIHDPDGRFRRALR